MSNKSAKTRHDATADSHQRALLGLLNQFGHSHTPERVFSDFVEISALSISNSVDRSQFEGREKRYLEIVSKYSKDEVQRFSRMLGELTLSLQSRTEGGIGNMDLTDVLGETFMMMEFGNARAGQFFTPYSVSKLMALMTNGGSDAVIAENGFTRVQEPACGAGGMVIAMADALGAGGHNFQETMHAICIDIDARCVHMAYLQLSLLGIPAVVVHGNALTLEVWGCWYTPMHMFGGWNAKLRRGFTLASRERGALADVESLLEEKSEAADLPTAAAEPIGESDAVAVLEDIAVAEEVTTSASVSRGADVDLGELADLFECAVAQTRAPSIFDKVDQMMLFN